MKSRLSRRVGIPLFVLAAFVMLLSHVATVHAQAAASRGVHLITSEEEFQNIKDRCEKGAMIVGSAVEMRGYLMKTGVIRSSPPSGPGNLDEVAKWRQTSPFDFMVMGPLGRVCVEASEAKRRFAPFTLTLSEANAQGVVIRATPGANFMVAESVDRVVLRRGETIIQPLSQSLEKTVLQNGFGASNEFTSGTFSFELSAFAPTQPLTVIVVGGSRNLEWMLTIAELEAVK